MGHDHSTTSRTDVKGRIIAFRKKTGMSRKELGKISGISWRTIEAWEQGWRQPHGLYLERIEEILKRR